MTKKIYILDTSALLSGKPLHIPEAQLIIPTAVEEEISPGGKDYQNLQYLKEKGLVTHTPTANAIKTIQKIAQDSEYLRARYEIGFDRDMMLSMARDWRSLMKGKKNWRDTLMFIGGR